MSTIKKINGIETSILIFFFKLIVVIWLNNLFIPQTTAINPVINIPIQIKFENKYIGIKLVINNRKNKILDIINDFNKKFCLFLSI